MAHSRASSDSTSDLETAPRRNHLDKDAKDAEIARLRRQLDTIVKAEVSDVLQGIINSVVTQSASRGIIGKRRLHLKPREKAKWAHAFATLREEYPEERNSTIAKRLPRELQMKGGPRVDQLKKWTVANAGRKRGRKYTAEFERRVLDEMVFVTVQRVNNEEKAAVAANICYSHDTIIQAAKKVQALSDFKDDPQVKRLKFRRSWVRGFLHRNAMRPRRITTQAKVLPPP